MLSELADVAMTALCAMQHFTRNETHTRRLVAQRIGMQLNPRRRRDLFAQVADITDRLNASGPAGPHGACVRLFTLVDMAGKAAAAYIGMVGQNPRKGITHTLEDLLGALADVSVAALCAMQHLTGEEKVTRAVLAAKVQRIISCSQIRQRPAASLTR